MKKIKNRILLAAVSVFMICGAFLSMPITSNAASLYWPVPGHTGKSQGFHDGKAIDISDGSIAGADVIAAMGGKVTAIFLCQSQHFGSTGDCNGFGTGIVIKGDDGRFYQYAHMQGGSIPSNVYYGAYVSAGQKIGKVGTTGNSSGYHLHFGISLGNYWNESGINPLNESYIYNGVHRHAYAYSVTKQPTCTEKGVMTYRCSCGASYTEAIAAKGHSYKNTVVAPTITEQGYTLHTCLNCGANYKDTYVAPPALESDGWYYCNTLPGGVTSDQYTIEYQNSYQKIQANSPGADWKNEGKVKDAWENSGGQYNSETDLPTSASRVLVRSVYYHFCGPNAGNEGNYEQTGKFVHYDEIPATSVIVQASGMDNGHPYYLIDWNDGGGRVWCKSGVSCDGAWGSHGARCQAWYKTNTYQDKVHVVQYKFTKTSEWCNAADPSADSVKVRFKKKTSGEEQKPDQPEDKEDETNKEEQSPSQPGDNMDKDNQSPSQPGDKEDQTPVNPGDNTDKESQPGDNTDKGNQTPSQPGDNTDKGNQTPSQPKKPLIIPAKVAKPSVKAMKSRMVKISWKKAKNANKYQLQIALNKSFKKGRQTKTITANQYTWKKLKKGSTYFVRVRGYNSRSGKYGSWSSINKVKVRK